MSESDQLQDTQDKMLEYIDAGVRLGWLLNPYTQTVEIYRPGREKEVKINPQSVSGEDVLTDFTLSLDKIF